MFSATFSKEIRRLAADLLNSPTEISVAETGKPADGIDQVVFQVDRQRKRELLSHTIGAQNWQQVLVFTRTKHGANRLAAQLESDGLKSAAIHGNKSQAARVRALNEFKTGKVRVLVATDVAGRGLHIEGISHVVNYTLPHDPEDYVHRIGRTGRAGATGTSISFACEEDSFYIPGIETFLGESLHCIHPDDDWLILPPSPKKRETPKHSDSKKKRHRPRGGRPRTSGHRAPRTTSHRHPVSHHAPNALPPRLQN